MYDTKKNVSRFVVFIFNPRLYNIRKRDIASFVSLNDLPAFLVYYYYVIVFV